MTLSSQLNHYRVLEPLAKGGMGEVYLAEDTRLIAPLNHPGIVTIHSFSPDGNFVYYVSSALGGSLGTLFRVPVLGGTPQRLLDNVGSRVTFSPDGQRFAFMRGVPALGRTHLMSANADGSDERQIATTEELDRFKLSAPSWSPDGRTILVAAQSLRDGPHNVCFMVDVDTGRRTSIGGRWESAADLESLPDGRSFVVTATEFGGLTRQLWQVMVPNGDRRRLTNDLNTYDTVSLSAADRHLATRACV